MGTKANAKAQSLDERTDRLLQEVKIWHELKKRMNGKLTEHQTRKIMELDGRVTALHRETTAANKAKEEAKLRSKAVKAPKPEPPRPESPKSGPPRPAPPTKADLTLVTL